MIKKHPYFLIVHEVHFPNGQESSKELRPVMFPKHFITKVEPFETEHRRSQLRFFCPIEGRAFALVAETPEEIAAQYE